MPVPQIHVALRCERCGAAYVAVAEEERSLFEPGATQDIEGKCGKCGEMLDFLVLPREWDPDPRTLGGGEYGGEYWATAVPVSAALAGPEPLRAAAVRSRELVAVARKEPVPPAGARFSRDRGKPEGRR